MHRIQYIRKEIHIEKGLFPTLESFTKTINAESFTQFYKNYFGDNPITTDAQGKEYYNGAKEFQNKSICPKGYQENINIFKIDNEAQKYEIGFYDYKSCMNSTEEQEEEDITTIKETTHVVETTIGTGSFHRKSFYLGIGISKNNNGTIASSDGGKEYDTYNVYGTYLYKGRVNMREFTKRIIQKYIESKIHLEKGQLIIMDETPIDSIKLESEISKITQLSIIKDTGYVDSPGESEKIQIKLILTSKDGSPLKKVMEIYKSLTNKESPIKGVNNLFELMEGGEINASYEEGGNERSIKNINKNKDNPYEEDYSIYGEIAKDIFISEEEIEYDVFRTKSKDFILSQ